MHAQSNLIEPHSLVSTGEHGLYSSIGFVAGGNSALPELESQHTHENLLVFAALPAHYR